MQILWCTPKIKIVSENKWMVTPMEFSKNNLGGIEESLRPFITELTHLCIGRWCTVTSEWTLEISSAAETWTLVQTYIDTTCINEHVLWMVEKCKTLLWSRELLKHGVWDFYAFEITTTLVMSEIMKLWWSSIFCCINIVQKNFIWI